MDRRQFSLAAMSATALLAGCHSETKPSLDATLLHNKTVRTAVDGLEQAMNHMDMRLSLFNAENWQDALSNAQAAATRLHHELDELKRALGYSDAG